MRLAAGLPYVAIILCYIAWGASDLLQCAAGGLAGLCGVRWRPSRRPESNGSIAAFIAGNLRYGSTAPLGHSFDNSASQPSGVGLSSCKAKPLYPGRWGSHTVDGSKSLGNRGDPESFLGVYHNSHHNINYGEENEIHKRSGSSDRRQSPRKADGLLHQPHGGSSSSGRRTHERAVVRTSPEGLCDESTSVCRLRSVHATQQAVHEGDEVQDIFAYHGRWVHGTGSPWPGYLLSVVGFLQSLENGYVDAGDPGVGLDPEVRAAGGEHGEATSRMLAFDSFSRRPCKIRSPFKIADAGGDQSQRGRRSTARLDRRKTKLGSHLQDAHRGPTLLAGARTCSRDGMVGLWKTWPAQNTCGDYGRSSYDWRREFVEGRSGTGAQPVGRRSIFTVEKETGQSGQKRSEEEEVEKRKRRIAKAPKRRAGKIKRKRKGKDRRRRTTVLQLEQQQWCLRWISTWGRVPRKHKEGSQVHEVHVAWTSVFAMPFKGKVKSHGDGRSPGDQEEENNAAAARRSTEERPGGEDERNHQRDRGGQKENKKRPADEDEEEEFG